MALTASPENQLQLIELAQIDTKLIQLDHQRVAIPELKAIQDLEIELGSIDLKTVAAQTEVSDLTQAQNDELNAKIEYVNTLTNLYQSLGITLDQFGITLEQQPIKNND